VPLIAYVIIAIYSFWASKPRERTAAWLPAARRKALGLISGLNTFELAGFELLR